MTLCVAASAPHIALGHFGVDGGPRRSRPAEIQALLLRGKDND
jgi:hypothetical protein